jgi:voltage-gated potassium channel
LILLNAVAVVVESFNNKPAPLTQTLHLFEYFSIIIFTVEYILRIWTAKYKYPTSKFPRLKYIFSFMGIVDLLAILPFYLPLLKNIDLRYLRILRLFRLVRIFKLNRYYDSLDLIRRVIKNEKEKLVITIFIVFILLLFASSIMYYIENQIQPEQFTDIPTTVWWAVATLTTIGYGDVYPITPIGKLLGGVVAILGIGLIALPSGIISSGLISETSKNKTAKIICNHCGEKIDVGN